MARPTKLTPDLIEKAKGYLPTCFDIPVYTEKGAMTYVNVNLPSKVGLAIYLEIDKTTVDDWCKEYTPSFYEGKEVTLGGTHLSPIVKDLSVEDKQSIELRREFSSIVKSVMAEQEKRLINNGLGGLYKEKTNAMLLSKHGYVTDKTETDFTSKGEQIGTILPEIIAEADRLLKIKKLNEGQTT